MARLLSLVLLLSPAIATAAPPVTAVAYSPKGEFVAFGTPGEVRVFNVLGTPIGTPVTVTGRVTALTFHPQGHWLAIAHGDAGKNGVVSLQPVGESGAKRQIAINAHRDAIYTMAFSPDGKQLATAGYDRVVHIWDVDDTEAKPAPRLTLKDHSDAVYGVAFHPDGKLLASVSADRAVKVWEVATGKRLYTLGDATDWLYTVAWSPDKKHLAAAGVDKSVRVWAVDADGAKLVHAAFAHESAVWRIAYSGDGSRLYSVGEDKVIKAWNTAKLTEAKVFDAQPDTVLDLALRPDGKQLALARFDGAGALLNVANGKPMAQLLPAVPTKPVPPKVARVAPSGGVRGATTRVTISGTGLDWVKAVTSTTPEITAKIDPAKRSATALEVDVTIGAAVRIGAAQFTLDGDGGKSAPVAFAVDYFTAAVETGITDSARNAMAVKQNTTVAGVVDREGDMDYYRFTAAVGDQIGVQVLAPELGSKLNPVIVLTDEAGAVLAEGTAALGFVAHNAGTYAIGVRDRDFRGGGDFTYRLHIGSIPVVTGVFPLAAPRGRTTSVHVSGVNLGEPSGVTTKVTVPAEAIPGAKVPVPLSGAAMQAVGKAEVTVAEFPAVVLNPTAGADIRVPGSADGILTKPNEAQTTRFEARKGERLVVEVLARRAGSPVDPVIEILDAAGKPVPLGVLRATAKTSVTFRDHDSSSTGIRLDAWNELAIDDYLYVNGEVMRILALPKGPDDDCQFYQTGGQRVAFHGTTPTHHSLGLPMYKVELHLPGKTFPPNGLPLFPLAYRNDDGGAGYGKDSRLFFDVPADGSYQVRVTDARGSAGPNHAYRVTVRHPKPDFAVSFNPTAPSVWKGGAIPVNVSVTRFDGFDGPVQVKLAGIPGGMWAPETFVEGGFNSTTFALYANADATIPADAKLKLIARATIGGKEVTREVAGGLPKVAAVGDIVTTVREQTIAIQPGKETRFTVDIARQGKFAGRVPIDVQGLPHGVRVLNIGLNGILITERDTSREVVLYAEPWVKPMEHPIVVLARREGTGAEHAAKSLLLKVK
ncbi:translocation protein TolB [Gemmata sp. SH-PL17]|uniref:WD40 repeat domain-containing protein n=1 Tax=Gemmata sp. SH-PL17 TaxID=1630693 RepID=UPI00078E52BB|nr:WD40 repeat domain-containing protein [Gemmata sp. SH-PL17]AMV24795.1 translocation protein TolB [Gemmata sp. SH-PL17]